MAVVVAVAAAGCRRWYGAPAASAEAYRSVPVGRGDIQQVVNSTGTVQPVLSVQVGAFVSGPIQKVMVDFNDHVKAGQLLAQVDPRIYKAAQAHEEASLAHDRADLFRIAALRKQAQHNETRGLTLRPAKAIPRKAISTSASPTASRWMPNITWPKRPSR